MKKPNNNVTKTVKATHKQATKTTTNAKLKKTAVGVTVDLTDEIHTYGELQDNTDTQIETNVPVTGDNVDADIVNLLDAEERPTIDFKSLTEGAEYLQAKIEQGKAIRLKDGKTFLNEPLLIREELRKSTNKMELCYVLTVGKSKKGMNIEQSYWPWVIQQYIKFLA